MTAVCLLPRRWKSASAFRIWRTLFPSALEIRRHGLRALRLFSKIDAGPYLKETMANAFEFISSNMVFAVTFEMTAALSLENANTYAVGISEFFQ